MKNKICVITGCNSGIGKATAIELAKKGFEIVMLVRNSDKSREAYLEIKEASSSERITLMFVDLASQESIRKVSEEISLSFNQIDVLINNAGVFKKKYEESKDGLEMTLAINYIAPFLLTNQLLPLLKKSDDARVINLTSELYMKGKVSLDTELSTVPFNGEQAYNDSKLLILYFTKELAYLLKDQGISVNAVHPGMVATNVFREFPKWLSTLMKLFLSKPADGAKGPVHLASSEELSDRSGEYFNKTKRADTSQIANNMMLSEEIRELTEELVGVQFENNDFELRV